MVQRLTPQELEGLRFDQLDFIRSINKCKRRWWDFIIDEQLVTMLIEL